jgi:hypothetical protein
MKKKSSKRPLDQAIDRHDRAIKANVTRGPEGRKTAAEKAAKKRQHKWQNLGLVALLLLCSACATAPGIYSFSNSKPYTRPYDQVWEDLVGIFAKGNIQIKNIAKDSGVIYAEQSAFTDEVADCPRGLLRHPQTTRQATVNVFVTRTASNPTVQVNTKFFQTLPRYPTLLDSSTSITVECNSKGVIERSIIETVTR